MEAWGFKHYGKDVIISLADNYQKAWEKMTETIREILEYAMANEAYIIKSI